MLILRDIEKYIGWYAMAIVYLGSGVAGSLGSAIFLPYHVEVSRIAKCFKSKLFFGCQKILSKDQNN